MTSAVRNTSPPGILSENIEDDRRLYRILRWGYITLVPYTALFIAVAALSNSSTMVVYVVSDLITLTVQAFILYAMRRVIAPNHFALPFGAGKLEDFSTFLCGTLMVPFGLYMGYVGLRGLLHPRPVAYGIALIPVIISVAREIWLYGSLRRLAREASHPPSLLHAQAISYRVGLLSDLGVLAGFAAGWALSTSAAGYGERIDPLLTILLSLYSVWSGVALVRHSFRPLIDLPLPEPEQLAILRALARHYPEYDNIPHLYTRASGRQRFVMIELMFPEERGVEAIQALNAAMERELSADLPGLSLVIRPVPAASSAPAGVPLAQS